MAPAGAGCAAPPASAPHEPAWPPAAAPQEPAWPLAPLEVAACVAEADCGCDEAQAPAVRAAETMRASFVRVFLSMSVECSEE
ncbi:MAG: hypothetical protein U0324_41265 [Polyangiales bacterium]